MRGRKFQLVVGVLLLLVMASPGTAARRSSLSGNLLIQDADDMFFFPQLVASNKRMVNFDFGTNAGLGSGGMVFGTDKLSLGMFAHRSDFLAPLEAAYLTRGDIDNIGNAGRVDLASTGIGVGPAALNWIDLLAGWNWGANPWGVRVSLGRNNDNPPADNVQSSVTGFNLVVGSRFEDRGIDLSGEFAMASTTDETAAVKTEASPWHIGVGVRRVPTEESDVLSLGWLGYFGYTASTVDSTPTGLAVISSDRSQFRLQAGAGPVYKPNARTNVAMYGTLRYDRRQDKEGDVKGTNSNWVFPGLNLAAEVEIASWLQVRGGLRSEFSFNDVESEVLSTTTHNKTNDLFFLWTSGLGIHFGDFTIDTYLNPDVVTTGTDLLGNSDRVFGMVSTTYHF